MTRLSRFERQLCNLQGKLFELSARKKFSSQEFVDFYMQSKAAKFFDLPFDRTQWLGEESLLIDVLEEKPDLPQGEIYGTEAMFWMGYLYRYWHFYTKQSSHEIGNICDAKTLHTLYPAYHTLDCALAIDRIQDSVYRK